MTYNIEGSEIYKMAQNMKNLTNNLFNKYFEKQLIRYKSNYSKDPKDIEDNLKIQKEKKEIKNKEIEYKNSIIQSMSENFLIPYNTLNEVSLKEKLELNNLINSLSSSNLKIFVSNMQKQCPQLIDIDEYNNVCLNVKFIDRKYYLKIKQFL